MKKKLLCIFLALIVATTLFASGVNIGIRGDYRLAIDGWLFDGKKSAAEASFDPGYVGSVEIGYAFNDVVALNFEGGFGILPPVGSSFRFYEIPLSVNGVFTFARVSNLSFNARVGLGWDFKLDFTNKHIYTGPMASLGLGADVTLYKGLSLGMELRAICVMDFNTKEAELDLIPLSLSLKYQF